MHSTLRIALFPGSFDPFTVGHEALVRRALRLFDVVVVAVGVNSDKHYMFSLEERVRRIEELFAGNAAVRVCHFADMTVDCCRRNGAQFIVRGIRNDADFEYEKTVAAVNHSLAPEIETVLLMAEPGMEEVSSTIERERILHSQSLAQHTC